ncbi:DNA primase [termite gut metagenome]|uniref:DNA primase n=1 Tax=termite gut metagenome TaxID=433724 RepID=A0A5J4PJ07_9ZZZZ
MELQNTTTIIVNLFRNNYLDEYIKYYFDKELLGGDEYSSYKDLWLLRDVLFPTQGRTDASFKVDYTKNLWKDFGINDDGTLIDLIMRMEHCSFHEVASKLEKKYAGIDFDSFSFHGNHQGRQQEQTTTILKVQPITHPTLIDFVRERKIDLELANRYCREIHYRINGRNYFGVGFRNNKGEYELNSPLGFKGCIPSKEIKTVRNNRNTCLVFEGRRFKY